MFIRELKDCEEFVAGDNCMLREILHPDKAELALRYSLAHAVAKPGSTVYIPPRAVQSITNSGKKDLVFICIVDPAWRKEDEEVV